MVKVRIYCYRIFLLFVIILGYFLLIQPEQISGDYNVISNNISVADPRQPALLAENQIDSKVNLKAFDSSFLPIIITSVVVIGILIFAMWQTIRSRKQF